MDTIHPSRSHATINDDQRTTMNDDDQR